MTNRWKFATVILTLALALSLFGRSLVSSSQAAPQPAMRNAMGHLQNAQAALKAATADKGGHRVKAIALVEQAIAEVRAGIAYDNQH